MYRGLEIEPGATLPAGCESYERAITLGGLSKTYGLPGLRIGWLATRDRNLITRTAQLKDYTTICASAPSEILAVMALDNQKAIVAGQRERLHANLKVLETFMTAHEDCFHWQRPKGGSICFPGLRRAEGAQAFCRTLVEKAGIMRPGKPVVFGSRERPEAIGRHAADIGARLLAAGRDYDWELTGDSWAWRGAEHALEGLQRPVLIGDHQVANAAGVLALLEARAIRARRG